MFERYSELARRALFFARYEASLFGSSSIGSEHLLLGLLREPSSVSKLLVRAGTSAERVQADIVHAVVRGEVFSTSVEIPFSEVTSQALRAAALESERLLHNGIGPEHLLLGLLHDPTTTAGSILASHGLSLVTTRDQLVLGLNDPAWAAPPKPTATITPTARTDGSRSTTGRAGSWALEGQTLQEVLARVFDTPETRIEVPGDFDKGARFDFSTTWPVEDMTDVAQRMLLDAITTHFHVEIGFERRLMDVYVVTAPDGILATQTAADELAGGVGGFSTFASFDLPGDHPPTPEEFAAQFPTLESLRDAVVGSGAIGDVSASNVTIDALCSQLEGLLDRLVVNETKLSGRFDMRLEGPAGRVEGLIAMLRDQIGLVLTPAQRDVNLLVVRRR